MNKFSHFPEGFPIISNGLRLWGLLEAPGGFWRLLEASGGFWRLHK